MNVFGLIGETSLFTIYAKDSDTVVSGSLFEFAADSNYDFSETNSSSETALGKFLIAGDLRTTTAINTVPSYRVNNGGIELSYSFDSKVLKQSEKEWCLTDDKSKMVNDLKLDNNILSGALILQTSLDGETWTEDVIRTDIFTSETNLLEGFYNTKDIQLDNGCYYRVIIAYKMRIKLEDKKIPFIDVDNFKYKKVAEVYEFYAINEDEGTTAQDTPRKELGNKINTGKDNGYSGNQVINSDDPHYGWEIGKFFVNGYTRETKSDTGVPVFLKNVGDKVTLWFNLSQDISCLNGKDKLAISEDINGYDQTFETDETNFKRGVLIIQYMDSQGVKHEPIMYTDYLAANARTGADTKVQLFEEGDYLISLDYEIKKKAGPFATIANYSNYKIFFEFSIRNSNCMVYPFDIVTGAELADNSITSNGFKLDMANSKYLIIDVTKSVLRSGADGLLTEDIRFNRAASDGEEYKEEGIYTFDVTNSYTGQHTIKTIYIGAGSYLKALSDSGMSVDELNEKLKFGAKVKDDGSIVDVLSETLITTEESEKVEVMASVVEETMIPTTLPDNESPVVFATDTTTEPTLIIHNIVFVIAILVFVICVALLLILKKHKARRLNKKDKEESDT